MNGSGEEKFFSGVAIRPAVIYNIICVHIFVQKRGKRVKMSKDIGIDLGTSTVLVSVNGRDIALKEPSVVAVRRDTGKIIHIGREAQKMLGRTPANVVAIKPLQDGVISQYELAQKMLQYFLRKVTGTQILRSRLVICIPGDITEVEEKAVLDAAMNGPIDPRLPASLLQLHRDVTVLYSVNP